MAPLWIRIITGESLFLLKQDFFQGYFEHCHNEQQRELSQKAPSIKYFWTWLLQNYQDLSRPKIRIPNIVVVGISIGKAMINCDPKGDLAMVITKIWMDPHAGEVAVGRVYSGSINQGESVWAIGAVGRCFNSEHDGE